MKEKAITCELGLEATGVFLFLTALALNVTFALCKVLCPCFLLNSQAGDAVEAEQSWLGYLNHTKARTTIWLLEMTFGCCSLKDNFSVALSIW